MKGVNYFSIFNFLLVFMKDILDIIVFVLLFCFLMIDVICIDWIFLFDKFVMSWGGEVIFGNVVLLNMIL